MLPPSETGAFQDTDMPPGAAVAWTANGADGGPIIVARPVATVELPLASVIVVVTVVVPAVAYMWLALTVIDVPLPLTKPEDAPVPSPQFTVAE